MIFTFELAMSYSPSGNILSKSMDALTFQSTQGGAVAVNYDNNYEYGHPQPHAISNISGYTGDQQFEWDLNGNLVHHMRNGDGIDIDRQLCWDEENRLTAVRDQNQLSAYIYDAGGERVWKLTGQVQQMQIGGGGVVDMVDLNNKTLYASPYLVYNEQGYSKHYYAGAERVSSRIGGGMQNALVDPLNSALAHLSNHDNYAGITSGLREMMLRNTGCAGFNSSYLSMEQNYLHSIEHSIHHSDPEPNWYIYHSDHLGSSSFLTDASGDPTQHLQYMPFGENFIEQRSITSYYTPYTFSAKERDLETGYSYFGARYYDADISVWLSVDPMADKYPSMSAYMYCAGNPVILVDPDGREIIITGDEADKALAQLQKTTNLVLTRDPSTGIISSTGDAISADDKLLLEAITNSDVTIKIDANKLSTAGEFHGTEYSSQNNTVIANYRVNPGEMRNHEKASKRWPWQSEVPEGTGMLHEISEGLLLGKESLSLKRSLGPASRTYIPVPVFRDGKFETHWEEKVGPDYHIYEKAHRLARRAPEDWHRRQRQAKREVKRNNRRSK
jgi:RHS repeat-associated protein